MTLPADRIVAALLRFGFREIDIARRFDVDRAYVSAAKRRLGLPMKPNGRPRPHNRNGAPPTTRYFG